MAQKYADNQQQHRRIMMVGIVFAGFYALMLLRAYQLQILGNAQLESLASSQYTLKLVTQPRRGAIFDRNGEVLAMDVMVSSVGVHPRQITDRKKTTELLSRYTGVSHGEIGIKLASRKKFAWIRRRIPLKDGDAVADAKIPGVQVVREYRRYYPNKELAGQVLGAVGFDAKALGGLELALDQYLKAESQLTETERDARGKFFTLTNDPEVTSDVYLSIDKYIQYETETALKENADKHAVKNGFAIVMDVETGEILAMANYPDFNPNSYWSYPQDRWKNHAVIDTFEPGSTFKSISVGAALNSGVKPSDKFNCHGGSLRVGKHTISDHGRYGVMSVQQILQVSSNIGVTKIAYDIGKDKFHAFIKALGFGERTGVELIGEASGFVRDPAGWKDIELSNIAFGQGIAVTGLQMTSAYATFANGGNLMKPFLVREIVGSDGRRVAVGRARSRRRVMEEIAADDLREMLFTVTQKGGTAISAHVDGYYAGGKTGTAQKVDPKTRAYSENQYVSSFIGFAPLFDPRIAIAVVYDTPRKNGYYGGVAAAPVFKKIAASALTYLGVAPTPDTRRPRYAVTLPKSKTPAVAKSAAHALPRAIGKPEPVKKIPDHALIRSAFQGKKMPDLEGLSLRDLVRLGREFGANVDIVGSGYVVRQTPSEGKDFTTRWRMEMGATVAAKPAKTPGVKVADKHRGGGRRATIPVKAPVRGDALFASTLEKGM